MTVPGPALAPVVLALLPTLGAGAPDGPPPDHVTPLLGPGGLQSAPYLRGIEDLATDSDGNLFVAARESSQVLRIAPDGQRTMLIDGSHDLLGWGFSEPVALAVDASDRLHVVSRGSRTLHRIDPDGTITLLANALVPSGGLEQPAGLAIDSQGTVYVSDAAKNSILRLDAQGASSVLTYVGPGGTIDQLLEPGRLAIDANDHLAVVCPGSRSVFVFGSRATAEGRIVPQWPYGDLDDLKDVAFDPLTGDVVLTSTLMCLRADSSGEVSLGVDAAPAGSEQWSRIATSADGRMLFTLRNSLLEVAPNGVIRDRLDVPQNPYVVLMTGAVACDDQGNAFVASQFTDEVYKVGSSWPVSFQPSCFGDGSIATCSCGNDAGAETGCRNSTGSGATLTAHGSDRAGLDDLAFLGRGLVPGGSALLFAGDAYGVQLPLASDGLRCVGGRLRRLDSAEVGPDGTAWFGPGLRAQGGWQPGDTRWFQALYLDPVNGPCGTGTNLTHAVRATFVP